MNRLREENGALLELVEDLQLQVERLTREKADLERRLTDTERA